MARFDPDPPRAGTGFYKAHGLGNDYLVVEEGTDWTMDAGAVARVCHRWTGVGGDGIVVLLTSPRQPFGLRMFNPDGGEFERSGNGLRVLASWLQKTGRVEAGRPFEVEVGGDRITMTVHGRTDDGIYDVSVEMGRARVGPDAVAMGPEALVGGADRSSHGRLDVPGAGRIPVMLVGVGNPHCVVFTDDLPEEAPAGHDRTPTRKLLELLGPALTAHPAFAHGTNVQLARVPGPGAAGAGEGATFDAGGRAEGRDAGGASNGGGGGTADALIWERGVGYTTASGTSACAVAVAAVESGRLEPGTVEVRMEGGSLFVEVTDDLDVVLRGPVEEVMTGEMCAGLVAPR